ncbi:MAG: hypothetical protein KatS3mg002_1334 [Candidatus Woesearchaeota archaeon]|nr:MAG: hypothetical protein KatS3mg002_1334 [Candidatus Woesearchaeota archaeon]
MSNTLNDYQEMLLFEYLTYKEIGNKKMNDEKYNEIRELEHNMDIVKEVVVKYSEQYPPLLLKYAKDEVIKNPDIFHWGWYGASIPRYAPELLEIYPNKFNWKLFEWAVKEYCPEYMKFKPKTNEQNDKGNIQYGCHL